VSRAGDRSHAEHRGDDRRPDPHLSRVRHHGHTHPGRTVNADAPYVIVGRRLRIRSGPPRVRRRTQHDAGAARADRNARTRRHRAQYKAERCLCTPADPVLVSLRTLQHWLRQRLQAPPATEVRA
jgi:hypothetical protein